jgi:predicted DNA-binding protein (MmcQ/YjbR family)
MFCGRSGIGSRVMLKATVDQQSMLIQHPGIEPAMYLGRYGWIEAEMSIEDELLEELIQESYRQVVAALPKSKRPT